MIDAKGFSAWCAHSTHAPVMTQLFRWIDKSWIHTVPALVSVVTSLDVCYGIELLPGILESIEGRPFAVLEEC